MSGPAAWASNITCLAALANDSGRALIGPIRDMIPYVLWKLVVGKFSTWADFCDAVKKVDDRELKVAVEEETRFTNLERENLNLCRKVKIHAPPMPPMLPMSSIACQMGLFSQSTPTVTPQATVLQNPFQGSQMSLNNLFAPHPGCSWEERSIPLAKSTAGMVQYANDKQGQVVLAAKDVEWNGDEFTPFPLTLGTTSVVSGEHF